MSDLSGRTTVVVGASRGLGRGIARAFTWLREALLKPLPPGSRVVVVSSGAAINGSPASGGYAGSKATQRFIWVGFFIFGMWVGRVIPKLS